MKDAQERLDKGAAVLARLIKQATQGADEACAAGHADAAKDLRMMAGYLMIAHGIGRGIKIGLPDGGVIAPAFGGDGKG